VTDERLIRLQLVVTPRCHSMCVPVAFACDRTQTAAPRREAVDHRRWSLCVAWVQNTPATSGRQKSPSLSPLGCKELRSGWSAVSVRRLLPTSGQSIDDASLSMSARVARLALVLYVAVSAVSAQMVMHALNDDCFRDGTHCHRVQGRSGGPDAFFIGGPLLQHFSKK
jgi:hypothetical protein